QQVKALYQRERTGNSAQQQERLVVPQRRDTGTLHPIETQHRSYDGAEADNLEYRNVLQQLDEHCHQRKKQARQQHVDNAAGIDRHGSKTRGETRGKTRSKTRGENPDRTPGTNRPIKKARAVCNPGFQVVSITCLTAATGLTAATDLKATGLKAA